jgi:hypothetical protein
MIIHTLNFAFIITDLFLYLSYSMYAEVEVEVEVNLRPTVSRPVRLGIGPPYGILDQILSCSFFFLLTIT